MDEVLRSDRGEMLMQNPLMLGQDAGIMQAEANVQSQQLRFIQTRQLFDYAAVLNEITELGEPFRLAILRWCELSERIEPLRFWEVFLLEHQPSCIGVSGLYQRLRTNAGDVWLGWFGIVASERRKGLGHEMLRLTETEARRRGFERLLVYCDGDAAFVHQFYRNNGFAELGRAINVAPGETARDDDLVLSKELSPNTA